MVGVAGKFIDAARMARAISSDCMMDAIKAEEAGDLKRHKRLMEEAARHAERAEWYAQHAMFFAKRVH